MLVDFFEGAEQSDEGTVEAGRAASEMEIAAAELIIDTDYGGAHGAVFVSSLRPCHCAFGVDPQSEAHCRYDIRYESSRILTGRRRLRAGSGYVSAGNEACVS